MQPKVAEKETLQIKLKGLNMLEYLLVYRLPVHSLSYQSAYLAASLLT